MVSSMMAMEGLVVVILSFFVIFSLLMRYESCGSVHTNSVAYDLIRNIQHTSNNRIIKMSRVRYLVGWMGCVMIN